MEIELRQLSLTDWPEITDMLQEIGPGENWFENAWYNEDFQEFLQKNYNNSQGIDLPEWYVPQTIYRLYIDNKVVGYGKLRHYLTPFLLKVWGHMGYCIRPSERGKKYGNIILEEIIKEAKNKGISKVLLTCNEDNTASRRVIEKNGWILENIEEKCRYRIDIT